MFLFRYELKAIVPGYQTISEYFNVQVDGLEYRQKFIHH